MNPSCPKCNHSRSIKSGILGGRQRFRCKNCGYHFTVQKLGKQIDSYYVVKALQLYLEGISLREIERILGVSHVTIRNWVRKYGVRAPERVDYHPTYKVLNHTELKQYMADLDFLKSAGMIVTELGDKFMLIRWERFRD